MFDESFDIPEVFAKLRNLISGMSFSTWAYLSSLTISSLVILLSFWQFFQLSSKSSIQACFSTSDQGSNIDNQIYVDVAGAVENPGLYQLDYGQRVAAAIAKAGGFSSDADKKYLFQTLNLAKLIEDGEKVYIPYQTELEQISSPITGNLQQVTNTNTSLISINTASLEELDTLPGIGEKRAQDIIDGRPYAQIDDLLEQEVLTETLFREIESFISI